jgi:hypothetical protein
MTEPRKGNWMQLASGNAYYPVDPRACDVRIGDIAHSLAMQCRYGGHSSRFYSVAEHSVLVSKIVPPEFALLGLLHDATEAYVTDVPRPLKGHLSNFEEIEALNWAAIAAAFDLPLELPACIHEADRDICRTEMRVLMPPPPIPIVWAREAPNVFLGCYPPERARELFLDRFDALWGDRMYVRYPAAYRRAA